MLGLEFAGFVVPCFPVIYPSSTCWILGSIARCTAGGFSDGVATQKPLCQARWPGLRRCHTVEAHARWQKLGSPPALF